MRMSRMTAYDNEVYSFDMFTNVMMALCLTSTSCLLKINLTSHTSVQYTYYTN